MSWRQGLNSDQGLDRCGWMREGSDMQCKLEGGRMSEPCTCLTGGSVFCKFPHPCRRCYSYHPGVSCYWHSHGKSYKDKPAAGRTFSHSDGSLGCDECCNGDRCDDHTHYDRASCPYCLGSGAPRIDDEISRLRMEQEGVTEQDIAETMPPKPNES